MQLPRFAAEVVGDFLDDLPVGRLARFVPDSEAVYILGCSGGLDSGLLALLYSHLYRAGRMSSSPVLYHVNHRLRLSAYRDERFVEDFGRVLDLPVYLDRCRVGVLAKRLHCNLEEAGRLVRYRGMVRLSHTVASGRSVYGVTAHHAGDFVETLLLKLLRGATENAFRMPDELPLHMGRKTLTVLRPLLFLDRPDLEALAGRLGLSFREDPSNQSSEFRRNRLRSRVLPVLREEGLRPGALWLRANASAGRFGMAPTSLAAKPGPIENAPSFLRLPLDLLVGAEPGESKAILDRVLRRLGCAPVQGDGGSGVLGEILRQSCRGRIEVRGPDFVVASSRLSLWILRSDSPLLVVPRVEVGERSVDRKQLWTVQTVRSPDQRSRTFALGPQGQIGFLSPGLCTSSGKKVTELMQELDVPVLLRCAIPLELRDGHLVRICLSWIGERSDFFIST